MPRDGTRRVSPCVMLAPQLKNATLRLKHSISGSNPVQFALVSLVSGGRERIQGREVMEIKMKKLWFAAAFGLGILGAAATASAADLAAQQPYVKAPPPPPPVFSWTGFYVGANIGGAWSNN